METFSLSCVIAICSYYLVTTSNSYLTISGSEKLEIGTRLCYEIIPCGFILFFWGWIGVMPWFYRYCWVTQHCKQPCKWSGYWPRAIATVERHVTFSTMQFICSLSTYPSCTAEWCQMQSCRPQWRENAWQSKQKASRSKGDVATSFVSPPS